MTRFEDVLDRCVAAMQSEGASVEDCLARYPAYRDELEPLLRLAVRLRRAQALTAPPEFHQAAAVRMRNLIASASPHPVRRVQPQATKPGHGVPWLRRSPALVTAAIVIVVVLLVTGGTTYASYAALPGTPLYPVKTTIERVQLALQDDWAEQAELHLRFAERRLQEAAQLAERGRQPDASLPLGGYVEQVTALLQLVEDPALPVEARAALAQQVVQSLAEHEAWLAEMGEAHGAHWQRAVQASQEGRSRAMAATQQETREPPGEGLPDGSDQREKAPAGQPPTSPSPTHTPSLAPSPSATATPTPSPVATPTLTPTPLLPRRPVRPTQAPPAEPTQEPPATARPRRPDAPALPTPLPPVRPTRPGPGVRPTDRPGPRITPPAITPVTPAVTPPVVETAVPPVTPPAETPVTPPVVPPVRTPVVPPVRTPVLPPVTPPAWTPVVPPIAPPAWTPVVPPITPPAQPPGDRPLPPREGPPRLPRP
ncbi:MAG: DUF5667 domain-containing protein [Caldilineales bacterium]|nr:DUF5667 domain-containing protein [Caldilineales bacterium]MDW8319047.1 DUF5667 domain-containing protein [Anaerolineae bacterium]